MTDASPATSEHADMPCPPQPGDEHARLAPFVGTFRCVVRFWMDPAADPLEMSGTMVNTMVHGGRFLRQDYESDPMEPGGEMPYSGSGYWGFDTSRGEWQGVWCDTASNTIDFTRGTEDTLGRVWTMHSEVVPPGAPGPVPKRDCIELVDADHHRMATWFGPEGAAAKVMELDFTRAD